MFKIDKKNIRMNEGDYGLKLPMTITNVLETDDLMFNIKNCDGSDVLSKELTYNSETKKYELEFTEEESNKLEKKRYRYSILQLRDGELQNTIVTDLTFEVISGA